jgi:hypothetical protein
VIKRYNVNCQVNIVSISGIILGATELWFFKNAQATVRQLERKVYPEANGVLGSDARSQERPKGSEKGWTASYVHSVSAVLMFESWLSSPVPKTNLFLGCTSLIVMLWWKDPVLL